MSEVDRAISDILNEDRHQEAQAQRIAHYEMMKAKLTAKLKAIDEDEQNASGELTALYEKFGIASWSNDGLFQFRERRQKAWEEYGAFLQTEKAAVDKARQELIERQDDAETLQRMQTVEGYLDVALNEWASVQPAGRRMGTPDRAEKPDRRLRVLCDIADRVRQDMFEWKNKSTRDAKHHSSGTDANEYIEISKRKNNAIKSLYYKVTQD